MQSVKTGRMKIVVFSKPALTVDVTVLRILKKGNKSKKVRWGLNVIQNKIILFDYNFVAYKFITFLYTWDTFLTTHMPKSPLAIPS